MRELTRRDFLKLSALVSASMASWACNLGTQVIGSGSGTPNGERVLIIGAGIAGLAAARELQSLGYTVRILEARNHIGGRIHTDRSLGFPVDIGASWIHGVRGNPITKLAKEFDLDTRKTDYDNAITYDQSGQPIGADDIAEYTAAFEEGFQAAREYAEQLDNDIPLQQAIDRIIAEEDLDPEDRQIIDYLLYAAVESDYAADASELSAWWFDADEAYPGEDYLFPNGYDQIINALAEGVDIQMNQFVRRVTYNDGGVQIETETDNFGAGAVIVTVPLGMLKAGKIQFAPALPAAKQTAIQRMKMGLLNKTVLKFAQPFWPKDTHFFGTLATPIGQNSFILNLLPFYNQPALIGFSAGSVARQMESRSDDQIAAEMMQNLRTMFGENIPDPEEVLITRWATNPFTFGSYSYTPVGSVPEDRDALAAPVSGRLYFAGEATHPQYPSTVHGAYLSGIRAAEELDNS